MENLTLVSSKPVLTLTSSANPTLVSRKQCFDLPLLPTRPTGSLFVSKPRSRTLLFALSNPNSSRKGNNSSNHGKRTNGVELFARISKASNTKVTTQETTSVGVNPQPYVAPPSSQFGSPLFWIGVGVGLSALFSFVSARLQKYAMQQVFKNVMGQMGSQNNQFNNAAFPSGSPFGFPPPSTPGPGTFSGFPYQPPTSSGLSSSSTIPGYTNKPQSTSAPSTSNLSASSSAPPQSAPVSPFASNASVNADISGTKSEAPEPLVNGDPKPKTEAKQSAFVDVSPEETVVTSPFENYDDTSSSRSSEPAKFAEVVQNGAASKEGTYSDWSQSEPRKSGSLLSVETLEKLMEDPEMQKMIYPHLPEEMRNPTTFKWMLQNPLYRQQLQEMLDNMGGGAVDNNLMENLKNFDLNSSEVKQQFDQIGITPEEAISKIIANPDIAMAFQNPRIQQALMDCSQNPMNIIKYQNDKEVMDVFNKIQELFPGAGGPGGF